MNNEAKLKQEKLKRLEKISKQVQALLYFIDDSKEEKEIIKIWKYIDKLRGYEK